MSGEEKPRETYVFLAKIAEQAERYEGKRTVFDAISGHFVLESLGCNLTKSVGYSRQTLLLTNISPKR